MTQAYPENTEEIIEYRILHDKAFSIEADVRLGEGPTGKTLVICAEHDPSGICSISTTPIPEDPTTDIKSFSKAKKEELGPELISQLKEHIRNDPREELVESTRKFLRNRYGYVLWADPGADINFGDIKLPDHVEKLYQSLPTQ